MVDWEKEKVGNVLIKLKRKKKIAKKDYLDSGKYPVIDQGETFISGYTNDDEGVIDDLPITIFGDHNRNLKFVRFPFVAGADGTQLLIPNQEFDKRYFYYALKNCRLKNYGYERHFKYLKEKNIPKPPVPLQKRISSIIGNYDDLIDNNSKRIFLLETIAQLVFEEWFINYNFPNSSNAKKDEDSKIPVEWEKVKVGELIRRLKAGTKYTQSNVKERGRIPVIDQSNKEYLGWHNNGPDHQASTEKPIMIFGDHTCKMKIMISPFSIGPNTIPFISLKYPEIFIFLLIKNLVRTREYKRHWNELIIKDVIIPPKELVDSFVDKVSNIFEQITKLEKQSVVLGNTRNVILPKLVGGEFDISELDIKVPEVES